MPEVKIKDSKFNIRGCLVKVSYEARATQSYFVKFQGYDKVKRIIKRDKS